MTKAAAAEAPTTPTQPPVVRPHTVRPDTRALEAGMKAMSAPPRMRPTTTERTTTHRKDSLPFSESVSLRLATNDPMRLSLPSFSARSREGAVVGVVAQLGTGPLPRDPAPFEYDDLVGPRHGGRPVGDDDDGPALDQF